MTRDQAPDLPVYGLPDDPGPTEPLPDALDTAERWRARARLVRPDAEPVGRVAIAGEWVPVYHRKQTVPIETDADLDATSAYPRASRVPGVYDYAPSHGKPGEGRD
ncbi:hypothetical protein AN478_00260 [Thiohalorhabdus denitrificans]|uniref:Uncharacterized protein n=1 Tax=Thiohalorhabdus denitrificans TaxID=381306 RepID=A0A0P9C949_9GAMM|nr:hypothetical protein [Thiohalorhabdus denitrificans]KPV41872.1 hypothetical protein AN478_00260 [Thiohalorhabdus denitrificans]SCY65040.1 hypothetical protein SAMN05661077_0022 [Thiohalorhabdus denitrificans]